MSKKKLQVEGITNELEGASLFFNQQAKNSTQPLASEPEKQLEPSSTEPVIKTEIHSPIADENKKDNTKTRQVSNNASMQASKHASTTANKYDYINSIRKTVKQVGKEAIFIRVTPEEKHALGSIVYSFNEIYRGESQKTSENEFGRIALNFLLEDFRENGNNSILARVLAALRA